MKSLRRLGLCQVYSRIGCCIDDAAWRRPVNQGSQSRFIRTVRGQIETVAPGGYQEPVLLNADAGQFAGNLSAGAQHQDRPI
jgi:hypothetical protein